MTAQFRYFAFLMLVIFAATSACTPEETGSDEPTRTENNQNPDAGSKDSSRDPGPCGEITHDGTCFANTALWCDFGVQLNSASCTNSGGTGCKDGACRGIDFGHPCDLLRNLCADGLECRKGTCTTAATSTLTVYVAGKGSVTDASGNMNCSQSICTINLPGNTAVRLEAKPATDWKFVSWSHGCSGFSEFTHIQTSGGYQHSCLATFERKYASLDVSVRGGGGKIQVDPLDILCEDHCEARFDAGQHITLTAVPDPGFEFLRWSGCSSSPTEPSITFFATGDRRCVAEFHQVEDLIVEVSGPGRVRTDAPAEIHCPGTCTARITATSSVYLNAIPDPGAYFVRWTGHCAELNYSGRINFSPPGPYRCKAIFDHVPIYPLTVTVVGDGTVTSNPLGDIHCTADSTCSKNYLNRAPVTLFARPNPNARFMGWKPLHPSIPGSPDRDCTEGGYGDTNVSVTRPIHCQASFAPFYTTTRAWQHVAPPPNVVSTQWKPDGTQIAVYDKKAIRFFDAENGIYLGQNERFNQFGSGSLLSWNPQGTKLATTFINRHGTNSNYEIHLHDAGPDPAIYSVMSLPAQPLSITWAPTGTILASGSQDGSIRIVDSTTQDLIHDWSAHNSSVFAIAWSPNGEFLASSSEVEGTRIWATETWTLVHEFAAPGWSSLDWNHDSTKITGLSDDQIHVASPDGTQTTSWPSTGCKSVSFDPTGTKLVTACDSKWAIWDVASQSLLYTAPPLGARSVKMAQWNPIRDQILVQYDDDRIRIFHGDSRELLQAWNGARNAIKQLVHNPVTNALYAASRDGFVYGLDASTGRYLSNFDVAPHTQSIDSIAFHSQNNTLLGAVGGSVYAWSMQTGELSQPWLAGDQVAQIGVSHDDMLATSLTETAGIRLWSAPGQPHTHTLTSTQTAPHIVWQPGGHLLASTSANTTHLWNTQTGLIEHTLSCPPEHTAPNATFSPDGQRIAIFCIARFEIVGDLNIWNTTTGALDNSVRISQLHQLAWRPDSETIAVVISNNHNIQIYDVTIGYWLLPAPITTAFGSSISSLTWSADGRELFVGSSTGTITAYDVIP